MQIFGTLTCVFPKRYFPLRESNAMPACCQTAAFALVALLPLRTTVAQSGNSDGPITASTYNALALRDRWKTEVAVGKWMTGQDDSSRLVHLLFSPKSLFGMRDSILTADRLLELEKKAEQNKAPGDTILPAGGIFGSNAGLQNAFVYGATDLVIARVRTELVIVALRRAREWFKDSTLLKLFPNTKDVITSFGAEPSPNTIQLLRAAGQKDLSSLPVAIGELARGQCQPIRPTAKPCSDSVMAGVDAISAMSIVLDRASHGQSPLSALAGLATADTTLFLSIGGRRVTRVAGIVAQEVAKGGGARLIAAHQRPGGPELLALFLVRDALLPNAVAVANVGTIMQAATQAVALAQSLKQVSDDINAARMARQAVPAESHAQILDRYLAVLDGISAAAQDGAKLAMLTLLRHFVYGRW